MRTTHTDKLFSNYPDLQTIHIKHEYVLVKRYISLLAEFLLVSIETSPPQPGSRVSGQVLQQSIPPESIHACCPGNYLQR